LLKFWRGEIIGWRKKKMTKIAAQEQKLIHTLDNIVEHHHGRPATAFWQAQRDSIQGLHLALQKHLA